MLYKLITKNRDPLQVAKKIKKIFLEYKIIHIVDQSEEFYLDVAAHMGDQANMEENSDGNKIESTHTHIKFPWSKPSDSYSHSQTRQPFHTDGSYESKAPELIYFFCKEQADYGGATIFVENTKLIEMINFYDRSFLHALKDTDVCFLKGNDYKIKKIIDDDDNLNWNWHRCDKTSLTERFHQFLEKKVYETGCFHSVTLKKQDALFFLDEKVLHGRMAFMGSRWLVKGGIYRQINSE